tara:strand:+ start:490 stop:741 length:252 start_codon:yes stop_codon:yes gene_type:complete
MYQIELSKEAEGQLQKFPQDLQTRIISSLERIKIRPYHFVKKKVGSPYFILRIGDYRAIVRIDQNKKIVFVVEFGNRKNIYRT